jgi:hypothetical protein
MKKNLLSLLFVCFAFLLNAQVVDRYPNIQSPNENSAIIAWRTATAGVGTINWGTSPGSLTNTITESAAAQIHAITIQGLQPNSKYYYQASSGSFISSVEYFYTAKPDSIKQFDFLSYGDCGFNNSVQNTIGALMAAQTVDFGVVVGDVDQNVGNDYDTRFFQRYTSMLKHTCHFTAIGNHDVITNNTNYTDAFHLPHNNPANSEKYYSFTWGNAKFITIDGNSDYTAGSAQYVWLQNELKCNDREWTFVFFHQPPWTNGWDISYNIPLTPFYHYQGNVDMRTSIVPLFEQYHVDFVLNGHAHNYQRGIYNGVHYFICGGAGGATPDTHQSSNAPDIQLELDINNYMKWSVSGDTVRYFAYDLNGAKVDSQILIKTFTPYSATITTTNATCGGNNGTATITVLGPHNPYSFNWSNGSTAATASALSPGTYNITITDANGCTKQNSAVVQQTTALNLQPVKTDETCAGAHDGKIVLNVTGGTTPYNYSWANNIQPDSLGAGTYQVTVTDAGLCTAEQTITIATLGGNTKPVLTTNASVICKHDSLQINATSGFNTYTWNTGNTNASFYATAAGQYFVQATDSFGCVVTSDTLLLTADSVPHLQIAATTFNLSAQFDATASSTANYYWDFGNGQTFNGTTNHAAYVYPDSGTYQVTLITQYYCGADTAFVTVHVSDAVSGVVSLKGDGIKISIEPNPFSNQTKVLIDKTPGENFEAKIFSVEGKLIRNLGTTANNQLVIERGNLSAGNYFLLISNNHLKTTLKLMVE